MPTPLAHALGGIAAGALVAGPTARQGAASGARSAGALAAFAVLGMLADADFLLGAHRGWSHSVTAAVVVGAAAAVLAPARPRLGLACGAAYATHVLLDWLGTDTVAPFGVMAFWPFDAGFYQAAGWFLPVCREYWLRSCWMSLVRAACLELLVMGPVAVAALGLAWRRGAAPRQPPVPPP